MGWVTRQCYNLWFLMCVVPSCPLTDQLQACLSYRYPLSVAWICQQALNQDAYYRRGLSSHLYMYPGGESLTKINMKPSLQWTLDKINPHYISTQKHRIFYYPYTEAGRLAKCSFYTLHQHYTKIARPACQS